MNSFYEKKDQDYQSISASVREILTYGYSSRMIINGIFDLVLEDERLENEKKSKIFTLLSIAEQNLINNSDEYIQLLEIMCSFK